jgi:RNA polymerase sigma-70 factor (ECF subfamily)
MVVGVTPGLSDSLNEGASVCPTGDAHSHFETIFLEHYGRVLRLLVRLIGNRTQGEDLANEVFWKLSRQSEHWLQTNNVGGWLYRTATHAGIDALRATSHRKQYEWAATPRTRHHKADETGPLREMLREEDRKSVQIVLRAMKPAQAQLLLMRADGASYKELAEALNVAVSGVGTLLNRAEAEFRKHYLKLIEKRNPL